MASCYKYNEKVILSRTLILIFCTRNASQFQYWKTLKIENKLFLEAYNGNIYFIYLVFYKEIIIKINHKIIIKKLFINAVDEIVFWNYE